MKTFCALFSLVGGAEALKAALEKKLEEQERQILELQRQLDARDRAGQRRATGGRSNLEVLSQWLSGDLKLDTPTIRPARRPRTREYRRKSFKELEPEEITVKHRRSAHPDAPMVSTHAILGLPRRPGVPRDRSSSTEGHRVDRPAAAPMSIVDGLVIIDDHFPALSEGDRVEVFGLTSEAGQQLNGMHGLIMKADPQDVSRWVVSLAGLERPKALKAGNLRKVAEQVPDGLRPWIKEDEDADIFHSAVMSLSADPRASGEMSSAPEEPPESSPVAPVEPPEYFCCPVTEALMEHPVTAADGRNYEKSVIQDWFDRGNRTSPMTGAEIDTRLVDNFGLKSAIASWLEENPGYQV